MHIDRLPTFFGEKRGIPPSQIAQLGERPVRPGREFALHFISFHRHRTFNKNEMHFAKMKRILLFPHRTSIV
jgi:hypothetical protein